MNNELEQKIQKLPVWAQDHIRRIQRQRDDAVRTLNDFTDNQKPSPISTEAMPCTGEQQGPSIKTHYIHANSVDFEWKGVRLGVSLRTEGIFLSWDCNLPGGGDCAFIPNTYQQAWIKSRDTMYKGCQ